MAQPIQPKTELFKRVWNFKDGPPTDMPTILGSWAWHGERGSGYMQPNDIVYVSPKITLPAGPCWIRIQASMAPDRSGQHIGSLDMHWRTATQIPAHQIYIKRIGVTDAITVEAYLLGRHIIHEYNGKLAVVLEYQEPSPTRQICMIIRNSKVRTIEIRELTPEEVPSRLRDVNALIKELGGKPTPGPASLKSLIPETKPAQ